MGLFDPPRVGIAKRIPKDALVTQAAIETYGVQQLGSFNKKKQEYALGILLSVWACNSYTGGLFKLSDSDYRWIFNMGNNCAQRLSDNETARVSEVMDSLIHKGLIPRQGKD